MANEKHVELLKSGVDAWNKWRDENPNEIPDLNGVDLSDARLSGVNLFDAELGNAILDLSNLSNANLSGATLFKANLTVANLQGADLSGAQLDHANLRGADFCEADLSCASLSESDLSTAKLQKANLRKAVLNSARLIAADLQGADLREASLWQAVLWGAILREAKLCETKLGSADLSGADLSDANLRRADLDGVSLVKTKLFGARLDECRIYGISVWDVMLDERTSQRNLIITPEDQDTVTVDDLKVAQFIYLLINNEEIRHVIDTITSKVVLILGRFTEERKKVLDAIRNELRKRDYLPVLFDFDKPDSRDLTETILTLAHMARFVIADITDAKAVPQELQKIVPNLPSLPVRPIILDTQYEYGMFKDFGGYLSVLPPYRYQDTEHLLESLEVEVIGPALTKAEEIAARRKEFEEQLAAGRQT